MSDPRIDPVVDRAVDELRKLPPVDDAAVSRIVAAAAAARVSPADDDEPAPARRPLSRSRTLVLAAAAAFAGFMLRGAFTASPKLVVDQSRVPSPQSPAGKSPVPSTQSRVVSASDPEIMPVPTTFGFDRPDAQRVTLVGDFNRWNPAALPLTRDPATGRWRVVVPITPGRHMYAFMVDDSVLTLDPGAPRTKDPALGAEASVVMVGKP